MRENFLKYVTPFRAVSLFLLVLAIIWYFKIEGLLKEGREPGLGGLIPYIYGFLGLLLITLDLILSSILEKEKNWIIQFIIIIIGMLFFAISSI